MRVPAEYRQHPVKKFNGNPLTEALFIHDDTEALMNKVTTLLEPEDFWNISPPYQFAVLQDFASVQIPPAQCCFMYMKFAALLLNTYSKSHPFSPQHTHCKYLLAQETNKLPAKFDKDLQLPMVTHAPTMLISGLSGVGKTTAVRLVLYCFPQVIEHHNYNGKYYRQDQIVWISIDLPSTASIKAFALNFFLAIDQALGIEEYYNAWSKKNHMSTDAHLNGIRQAAKTHELGLIHIDELQFLLKYAKSKESPTLQILEALFNKIGIPMILSSTTAGLELFAMPSPHSTVEIDITTTRRTLNDRHIELNVHARESQQFKQLFNAFFPDFLQTPKTHLCAQFQDRFHYLSCGLPAIMSRMAHLYHETLVQLVDKKSKKIPEPISLLEHVYNNQFKLIAPALEQLRLKNIRQYEAIIADNGKKKAAYSDREKRAADKCKQTIIPSVKKGGMFENNTALPIDPQKGIPRGLY